MPNFSNNNRERKNYQKLEKAIAQKADNSSGSDLDVNLYLAKMYNSVAQKLRNNYMLLSEAKLQNKEYIDILRENLKLIYEKILSQTKATIESLRYNHNQQFSIIGNRAQRPLILDEKDVENIFLQTEEDSSLELLAKNMDWLSKTSKEVESVSKSVLEKMPGDLEINVYTMRYIYDYISGVCANGEIIRDHLLGFSGDLDNQKNYEDDETMVRVSNMLSITNEKFNTNITMNDVYKFASCKRLEEYLYRIKAFTQIELYRREAEYRKQGEKTGVTLDIERDKNMNGTNFNTKYSVYIPFYINSFRDHSDTSNLSPIIHKQVLEGEDPNNFPIDSLEEIPFRPFITFKLDRKRILELYNILEEYDNPKINCFLNDENRDRLNKVYGYFSDILHYSIYKDGNKPSSLLQADNLQEFKRQMKKDREEYSKILESEKEVKSFEEN